MNFFYIDEIVSDLLIVMSRVFFYESICLIERFLFFSLFLFFQTYWNTTAPFIPSKFYRPFFAYSRKKNLRSSFLHQFILIIQLTISFPWRAQSFSLSRIRSSILLPDCVIKRRRGEKKKMIVKVKNLVVISQTYLV